MNNNSSLIIGGKPLWKWFLYIVMFCLVSVVLGGTVSWLFRIDAIADVTLVVMIIGLCSLILMDNIIRVESKKKFVRIVSYIALALNVLWAATWCLNAVNIFGGLKNGCTEPLNGLNLNAYNFQSFEEFEEYTKSTAVYFECARSYETAVKATWSITAGCAIFGILLTALAGIIDYENYNPTVKKAKYAAIIVSAILVLVETSAVYYIQTYSGHYRTEFLISFAVVPLACLLVMQVLMTVYKNKQISGKKNKA